MYETFDHTADVGLRVEAADLETLFVEAAHGLFSLIVDAPETIVASESVTFTLDSPELDLLLFDWLNALLGEGETRGLICSRFKVERTPTGIVGRAWGTVLDTERHHLAHEVKAITYHGLKVVETTHGWLAEVIVDI